ncbi:MAG: hypothetical protein NTV34_12715 [Proteobacteria bacterium]|nr:hypothetical protein [Pseudomonadota bacterium]
MHLNFYGMLILCLLASCKDAESPGTSPAKRESGDQSKTPGTTTQAPSTDPGPTGPKVVALAAGQMKVIQGVGSPSTSLLEIVKASGKALGVFQFSGVTCESCKADSPRVMNDLRPYSKDLQTVVVFPNAPNDYSAADYLGFVSSFAQGAKYAIDGDLSVLKSIRKKSSQFFGLYILLKKDGSGLVLANDDSHLEVLKSVKLLLGGGT